MTEKDFHTWQKLKQLGVNPPEEYYHWLDWFAAQQYGIRSVFPNMNERGSETR